MAEVQPAKAGFLEDSQGNHSSTRLLSFASLAAAIWFTWMAIAKTTPSEMDIYFVSLFVVGAFAPQRLQAFIEARYPKSNV